ncbi:sphingosine-1-phosphate transporter MFSD2B isoform X1 [Microcaecilia unicolor]|uniref:Major facilitator superfamily domain-containing protein 2B isoform X1 n=1 Tax=Microcaecilia unicolor TaxID=1415580 RepID=A0A6P7XQ47_9AMPH|nr:major facilitator superfamily domain-containing protein 2B isoform X1 [Microcaecilia unicolor]XP_030054663.1 major facilitator superfamily domain-containing protein 2B isoform X1 [Microcaecilia unicolor]
MAERPGDTKHISKGVSRGSGTRLNPLLRARQIKKEKKLSVLSKLCYAIGGAPNQVAGSASAFFLQIYLLDVAQITPLQTSLVLSVGKVWGGITDPIVGYFINKSKWTKIGRLMPWIIGCTPFLTVSYLFLWFAPPFLTGRVLWYLTFYCLFQALTTVFHVPYSTLTMFLSTDQKERDSATAYRMTVEVLGTLLGAAVQGQIVASAHISARCALNNETANFIENTTHVALGSHNSSLSQPLAYQLHAEKVYMIAAGIIGGVYLFCTAILFFGVTEKDDPYALNSDSIMPFFRGFKLTMKHGPYLNLTAAFLLISAAVQLEQSNFVLFCTHAADLGDHFQNLVLTILISAVLSVPFWQWFLQRFGKKSATFGISWMIPFAVLLVTIPNLIVAYLVAVTSGLSIAASLLLPWSMLPDVVDDFRLLNPQAKGLETIFYSSFVFFTRLSAGIALGISSLSLEFTGYSTGACKQPYHVAITLRVLIGAVPAALIIIGLLILIFYPISEEKRRENEHALNMIRYRPKRRPTLLG